MADCFVILLDGELLIVLTGIDKVVGMGSRHTLLDWYAKHYAFERSKLTGYFASSIPVGHMKYEEFLS